MFGLYNKSFSFNIEKKRGGQVKGNPLKLCENQVLNLLIQSIVAPRYNHSEVQITRTKQSSKEELRATTLYIKGLLKYTSQSCIETNIVATCKTMYPTIAQNEDIFMLSSPINNMYPSGQIVYSCFNAALDGKVLNTIVDLLSFFAPVLIVLYTPHFAIIKCHFFFSCTQRQIDNFIWIENFKIDLASKFTTPEIIIELGKSVF